MNKRQQAAELAAIEAELTAARATVAAYAALYSASGAHAPTDDEDRDAISDRWNGAHDRVSALEALRHEVERAPEQVRYRRIVPQATRDLVAANID